MPAATVGDHAIFIGAGTVPSYLNISQSPYDFLYSHTPEGEGFKFTFTTTADEGPPPDESARVAGGLRGPHAGADDSRTTFEPLAIANGFGVALARARANPDRHARLTASGLQPDTDARWCG